LGLNALHSIIILPRYKSDKFALSGIFNEVPGPGAYYDINLKKCKYLKENNDSTINSSVKEL